MFVPVYPDSANSGGVGGEQQHASRLGSTAPRCLDRDFLMSGNALLAISDLEAGTLAGAAQPQAWLGGVAALICCTRWRKGVARENRMQRTRNLLHASAAPLLTESIKRDMAQLTPPKD